MSSKSSRSRLESHELEKKKPHPIFYHTSGLYLCSAKGDQSERRAVLTLAQWSNRMAMKREESESAKC